MDRKDLPKVRATFAAFLKEARNGCGLSQREVAERMGVEERVVEEWERAGRQMDIVELRAYCCAIGLSISKCLEFVESICEGDGQGR